MQTLNDIKILENVKVLLRVDFNVPVENGKVVDDFRIRKTLPTIHLLQEKKAKIILIAHIEGNEKGSNPSLAPVVEHLKTLGLSCTFVTNYRNANATIESMQPGDVIMLENLRLNEGEKKNDKQFAKELASLADIYVNDAFSVSHRAHASIVAVTEYIPSYAGPLLAHEVEELSRAFKPKRPFLFVLGGAKFETKVPLIEKFIETADMVFIGGALAHNFFKEKGYNIGQSLVSAQDFNLKRFFGNLKLLLPIDVSVIKEKGQTPEQAAAVDATAVTDSENIMDAGPRTLEMLKEKIASAEQILWNGPIGAYEAGFKQPTIEMAKAIASSKAYTIVGGGDTLATIAELNNEDQYSFVSTGGGAMLDFLAMGTIAGVDALNAAASSGRQ